MEQRLPKLDSAIRSYYERSPEEDRLETGASRLEAARTRSLIERFAPPAPATVLDIGGAAGAYAIWLARAGYAVHLVDAVRRLVDLAQQRAADALQPLASCTQGDVRALGFESESIDMVLLLGPLYHLTSASDRALAWSEVARVLKPGGIAFAAGISRWASALDALSRDLFQNPVFLQIVERDLREGQHRNPTDQVSWFTTAYFHRPEELRAEAKNAGLTVEDVFGLEGPGWMFADFDERWANERRRADLIRVAEAIETEPSMAGVSAHLLAVARKPR